MELDVGNRWNASCDYGTVFENELLNKAKVLESIIEDIKKELQSIKNENKNSEMSDAITELISGLLGKLESTRIELKDASTRIQKYYN